MKYYTGTRRLCFDRVMEDSDHKYKAKFAKALLRNWHKLCKSDVRCVVIPQNTACHTNFSFLLLDVVVSTDRNNTHKL